jgi:endonuclease/exonuclease/phosphatase family metal-dependent hydrolase
MGVKMPKVRIGTFNVENLFARFKFNKKVKNPASLLLNGWTVNNANFEINDNVSKKITGQVIDAVNADIICLQEVENRDTLKAFKSQFMKKGKEYKYTMLIDGNDQRRIDVAILSKYRIFDVESFSHLYDQASKTLIFSRDCLKARIEIPDVSKPLTFFVNHLKSMIDMNDKKNGRANTRDRRILQCKTVKKIIADEFGSKIAKEPFIICGDFNDYIDKGLSKESGIPDLVNWDKVYNISNEINEDDRWTHFYSKKKEYKQLDYILVSKALEKKIVKVGIERRGLPLRANLVQKHFPGVDQDKIKASDHCAFYCDIEI